MKKNIIIIYFIFIALFTTGCPSFQDVMKTVANLQALKFKIDRVNNFSLNRVNISNITSIKDLSFSDGLLLTQAYSSKSLPTSFNVIVLAQNPNEGVKESKGTPVTMNRMEWDLYIDDIKTVSGVVEDDFTVDPSNATTEIPITISMDFYKFFANKGYDGMLNLAMQLGGVGNKPAKVMIDAKPEFKTKFGVLPYPSRIKIVDKEFR
jgi:hypothetical protein